LRMPPDSNTDPIKVSRVLIETKLRYAPPPKGEPRIVSFQFAATERSNVLLTRLGIEARYAGETNTTTFTLTNGGNVETIEPSARPAGGKTADSTGPCGDGRSWLGIERFKALHALMQIGKKDLTILIVVPAPMAETWEPIARSDSDLLTTAEQSHVADSWRRRLATAVEAKVDGTASAVHVESVRLIRPDESASGSRQIQRTIGFHAARIVGTIRIPVAAAPRDVALTWRLFNDAVHVVRVLVCDGSNRVDHTVGEYAPTIRWRAAPAESRP